MNTMEISNGNITDDSSTVTYYSNEEESESEVFEEEPEYESEYENDDEYYMEEPEEETVEILHSKVDVSIPKVNPWKQKEIVQQERSLSMEEIIKEQTEEKRKKDELKLKNQKKRAKFRFQQYKSSGDNPKQKVSLLFANKNK